MFKRMLFQYEGYIVTAECAEFARTKPYTHSEESESETLSPMSRKAGEMAGVHMRRKELQYGATPLLITQQQRINLTTV